MIPERGEIHETVVEIIGDSEQSSMIGVLTCPVHADYVSGVVIVPGGAQNRVGSRRRFVDLARRLATAGHCVLRFDVSGMGDSAGSLPSFERYGPDIRRAIAFLETRLGSQARITLWGHCDGATGSILFAADLPAVRAVVGLNPWVHTPGGHAKAMISTYYAGRFLNVDAWKRLLQGRVNILNSVRAFLRYGRAALSRSPGPAASMSLPDRLSASLKRSRAEFLFLIGEEDLTGAQFLAFYEPYRQQYQDSHVIECFPEGDHALSDPAQWEKAVGLTIQFLQP